jgi:hypothetical protein
MLSDEVLEGVGSSGTAYMTGPWRELRYLIRVITAIKKLPEDKKAAIIKDPWVWSGWLENATQDDVNRQLYHMLSFFLFPDFFERIASGSQKCKIIAAVKNKSKKEVYDSMSWLESKRSSNG